MAKKKNKQKNSVRIISGQWRSRHIQFLDQPHIRPTPNRVRETLFNWLGDSVAGSQCLDLFAGSGALGFEAASRGAEQVILVEADQTTNKILLQQKETLKASRLEVVHQDALAYLNEATRVFDIVFIDPPFASELYYEVISTLLARHLITSDNLLYIESSASLITAQKEMLDKLKLSCLREKSAGEVHFGLYRAANL